MGYNEAQREHATAALLKGSPGTFLKRHASEIVHAALCADSLEQAIEKVGRTVGHTNVGQRNYPAWATIVWNARKHAEAQVH